MALLESKLPRVGTTIFTRMSALAAECNALNLSQGFPDFDAPAPLLDAMARHVMAGHNQYAPMAGVLPLREQIVAQAALHMGINCDPDSEITVVPGATEGIFCAVMASVNPGDEVIVFDPCYDSYEPSIELAGGRAVHIPLTEHTFAIDWERVESAITSRTRLIIVNSPHNPSGSTLSHADLFCRALKNSRFSFTPSAGTYFQLLDYSAIVDTPDTRLAEDWTRQYGLASIPVSVFYQTPPAQCYLRFCFAKSDDVLLEAADILCTI